jgi:hypothetical protein
MRLMSQNQLQERDPSNESAKKKLDLGVARVDFAEAACWFRKAADRGNAGCRVQSRHPLPHRSLMSAIADIRLRRRSLTFSLVGDR